MSTNIVEIKAIASSESYLEGFEPQKALDGRVDTAWKADPYFKWIMLDTGAAHYIDHINLITGHDGKFYHYHVEYSSDRINWDFVIMMLQQLRSATL